MHLYGDSTARVELAGARVELAQRTRYPWDGAVRLEVTVDRPARFAVSLRIPGWARGASLAVNGAGLELGAVERDGYARIEREWRSGDRVDLDLPLVPRALWANPLVRQDAGRVALVRGPLVYCLEGVDCGAGLNAIALDADPAQAATAEIAGARRGGRARPGRPARRRRLGRHALPRGAARARPAARALRALLSLGQPRARGDAGLGAVRGGTGLAAAGAGRRPARRQSARATAALEVIHGRGPTSHMC